MANYDKQDPKISFDTSGKANREAIENHELIFLSILPSEVSMMDFSRLNAYIKLYDDVGKKAYGTLILSFAYDNDPREIYEIPEACEYIKAIFDEHPDLLYYVVPAVETYRPLLLPCWDVQVVSRARGNAQLAVPNIKLAAAMAKDFVSAATEKANEYYNRKHAAAIKNTVLQILPYDKMV